MADRPAENIDEYATSKKGGDLALTENTLGFAPSDLIECRSCHRNNSPDRTGCLYCGHPFELPSVRAEIARVSYKRPELWEDGFSLVYSGNKELDGGIFKSASDLLRLDESDLEKLLSIRSPVPLIYLRSLADAQLLAFRLSEIGFDCAVVGDDLLQAETPPTRLRSVHFTGQAIVFSEFNTSKQFAIGIDDRVLIVNGSITKASTEERGKIKKRAFTTSSEVQSISVETVIDLYPASDVFGFRIRSAGFDFSGLGDHMKPFASANVIELVNQMRAQLKSAVFIDRFHSAKSLLDDIWVPDEVRQASEVSRGTLGGVQKRSITVLDNSKQFTKYSRLQRHFI